MLATRVPPSLWVPHCIIGTRWHSTATLVSRHADIELKSNMHLSNKSFKAPLSCTRFSRERGVVVLLELVELICSIQRPERTVLTYVHYINILLMEHDINNNDLLCIHSAIPICGRSPLIAAPLCLLLTWIEVIEADS